MLAVYKIIANIDVNIYLVFHILIVWVMASQEM